MPPRRPPPPVAPPRAESRDTAARQLVEAILGGDEDAFRTLVERFGGLVGGVIGRLVRDPDVRQDLMQETFYRAYRHLSGFDTTEALKPWLLAIAVNAARDHLRRQRRWQMVSLDGAGEEELEVRAPAAGPALVARGSILAQRAEAAFARLPEPARAILWLRVREELSYAEIATVLDVPRGTVMSRLARARRALRRALDEEDAAPLGCGRGDEDEVPGRV